MVTVILGVAAFSIIAVFLSMLIIGAEWKLKETGEVTIQINDDPDKDIAVQAGSNLLNTLAANEIYLPSACGGGGTCGTCKCQVFEGGGDILPIEENHINRKMARDHWRLSCQVKVRENMKIGIPEELLDIKKYHCRVESNKNVATFIKELVLRMTEGESLDFEPGGYVQIDIPEYSIDFSRDINVDTEYRDDWEGQGLFNLVVDNDEPIFRAYSMANHPAEGNIIKLNVRIATPPWNEKKQRYEKLPAGIASTYIFSLKEGDEVDISGPFGDFFIQETDREMVYIGGGAGMAPLRSHIFHLFKTLKTDRKVTYWYGARSVREIFYEEDFRQLEKEFDNFSFHIALSEPLPDDNWDGPTGFVHNAVYEHYLKNHKAPEDVEYYLCGPPVMLGATHDMLYNLGVEEDMIRFDDFG